MKRRGTQDCRMHTFPASRRFDYAEIMERPIVWPGDEP
jgi:hypothetical protein